MLFRKSATQNVQPLGHVVLIGDSPLAFLLAYLMQNNNFTVSFLSPSAKTADQSVSLTLKADSFQTKHFFVNYTNTPKVPVDFCCIASSPNNYKKDFLLFQNPLLKNIPILNFSHLFNRYLFEEQKDKNLIPAYYTGWINFEKSTLEILGGTTTFEICCPLKTYSTYENLFKNTFVEIRNLSTTKPFLWQHQIPFILSNLFIAAYKKDFLFHLKQKDVRQLISTSLKELCTLAKKDKEEIKESDILAFLYTIPEGYKSEFSNAKAFFVLENILPQVSYFETPSLHKLFFLANKS